MADKSTNDKTPRRGAALGTPSGTPWATTPQSAAKADEPQSSKVTETVHMGPAMATAAAMGATSAARWSDSFDFAPWAGGPTMDAAPRAAPPMSPQSRARLQATLTRFRDADPIDSYENPWGESDGAGKPMSRRDAIRARAAAKRLAQLVGERDAVTGHFVDEDHYAEAETSDTQIADDNVVHDNVGHAAEAAPARSKKEAPQTARRPSYKIGGSRDITIESLPYGVINVIGDGIVAVVDGTIAAGTSVSTAIKPVTRLVPPAAAAGLVCIAGVGVFYGYSQALSLAWKV
ncbi:hypothetical protein [Magnetovibrio blakemorei]|uniref:Uncharacterized protein n=2 Tax=Pseudomonadota TaxID=1224 RepID=C4RAF2_9PROT|nr:hypothetical protein [Magnetovibrio blakemorei]ASN76808.1 hypothetical protein [Vibrio sp. MV-1]OEJ69723.1 hypothetical protein BEN30_00020 [Magnetovibrio blakemorei]CAV30797.1 hypothetical protein mv1g00050 [Magnetovibrio blakemorei]